MPRPRPPHLHRERTRHNATVWYVRVGKRPRVRIRGDYGSREFMAAYEAALAGEPAPAATRGGARGSLAWLIERYRASGEWLRLAPATRRQRDNIFTHVIANAGAAPAQSVTRQHIARGRDDRAATPFAAANFLKTMRGLFRWALAADIVDADPTAKVEALTPRTKGFHAWTEEEIVAFEARWPVGTRERLAMAILLYTGLRRGDASRLGRQHVRDGVITVRTEKTGELVVIPMLPELARIIAATRTGDMTFIATATGKPMVKEAFGNWFKAACVAAGVPGSAHGLRKAGATRAANNGATVAQLEAIFGWHGGKMASLYTRTADRARLARAGIEAMAAPETRTSIPAPTRQVRESDEKQSKNQ